MIVSEKKVKVGSSKHVAKHIGLLMERLSLEQLGREHFWMMTLNGRHVIQRTRVISMGSLTCSIVHPRECFLPAVRDGAASVIFAHNHPSGDPDPSEEDKRLTDRLVEAGQILGIKVLDHVIVAKRGFISLMDGSQG